MQNLYVLGPWLLHVHVAFSYILLRNYNIAMHDIIVAINCINKS